MLYNILNCAIMKQLKKIRLRNAVVLENQEMKMIFGGSGLSGGCFSCRCHGETNPPFNSSWTAFYISSDKMAEDLDRRCSGSGGGCSQVSSSNCF